MVASRVCAVAAPPVDATPHVRRNSRVQRDIVACFVGTRSVGIRSVGTHVVGARNVGMRSVGMRSAGTRFLPGGLLDGGAPQNSKLDTARQSPGRNLTVSQRVARHDTRRVARTATRQVAATWR